MYCQLPQRGIFYYEGMHDRPLASVHRRGSEARIFPDAKTESRAQGPATDRPDALVVTHGGTLAIERGSEWSARLSLYPSTFQTKEDG